MCPLSWVHPAFGETPRRPAEDFHVLQCLVSEWGCGPSSDIYRLEVNYLTPLNLFSCLPAGPGMGRLSQECGAHTEAVPRGSLRVPGPHPRSGRDGGLRDD